MYKECNLFQADYVETREIVFSKSYCITHRNDYANRYGYSNLVVEGNVDSIELCLDDISHRLEISKQMTLDIFNTILPALYQHNYVLYIHYKDTSKDNLVHIKFDVSKIKG